MSTPLIDEIVNGIVDKMPEAALSNYCHQVVEQDETFDITAHCCFVTASSLKDILQEIVFQHIYDQVWNVVYAHFPSQEEFIEETFLKSKLP